MISLKHIHKNADSISGWLSHNEGELLFKLASKAHGDIVEIGSYEGKSTYYLCMGKQNIGNGAIYAVDTFTGSAEHRKHGSIDTYDTFTGNMKRLNVIDNISIMKMESVKAAELLKGPFALIFIDGSHEYADIKQDIMLWSEKLEENGVIAVHDMIDWDGPKRAFYELILKSFMFSVKGRAHSLMYAEKKIPSVFECMMNYIHFALRGLYEIAYRIKRAIMK